MQHFNIYIFRADSIPNGELALPTNHKPGCEQEFHAFEDKVLPLLKNHNAELVYRIRPNENAFVEASAELPYEIHLVTFINKDDFKAYAADPKRLAFMEMKNNSVEKIILIEGFAL